MTVIMAKDMGSSGRYKIELIYDPHKGLGRCRGVGDYVVRRPNGKHYRIYSMLPEYKRYKADGYKVALIY